MESVVPSWAASVCIAHSLVVCRKAFLSERWLVPRQSVFSERVVLPVAFSALLWLVMLGGTLLESFHVVGVAALVLLLLDRHIAAPHLFHFLVFCLGSPEQLRLFFCFLYLFGGLQKMNQRFATSFLQTVFGPFAVFVTGNEETTLPSIPLLGYAAAVSEAIYGVLLMVLPPSFVYLFGVSLHLLILTFVGGPFGPGGFHGIIGWNAFCLVWNLGNFLNPPTVFSIDWTSVGSMAVVALFFVVPLLNVTVGFGERISFKMHSQNNAAFEYCIPKETDFGNLDLDFVGPLPRKLYAQADSSIVETHDRIFLHSWVLSEAYLMPPISPRTSASLARHLSATFGKPVRVFRINLHDGSRIEQK